MEAYSSSSSTAGSKTRSLSLRRFTRFVSHRKAREEADFAIATDTAQSYKTRSLSLRRFTRFVSRSESPGRSRFRHCNRHAQSLQGRPYKLPGLGSKAYRWSTSNAVVSPSKSGAPTSACPGCTTAAIAYGFWIVSTEYQNQNTPMHHRIHLGSIYLRRRINGARSHSQSCNSV
ncbi:hypothetical protein F3Y22_tig00110621pilonHSYRG00134 [Hibiscus syriacus]|uniref:Uncharacterized protein n=1 Tax=Hibiscus syriacus TaxID=106335 RepID=A0A6A2ZZA5_HIBSY|nr:hypothetical protein F3Y22_tig00110621pilonHSYRG00134 [Hibiscus syriacus]